MDNKESKKEKRKTETEAVERELEEELTRLREDRLRAKKFAKKAYFLLLVAVLIPLLFTQNAFVWILSLGSWVAWVAMLRARRNVFKK